MFQNCAYHIKTSRLQTPVGKVVGKLGKDRRLPFFFEAGIGSLEKGKQRSCPECHEDKVSKARRAGIK
jgi:hypothetical protein